MRQIRQTLRLHFDAGLSYAQLAREIKAYIEALKAERALQAEQAQLLEHDPGAGVVAGTHP